MYQLSFVTDRSQLISIVEDALVRSCDSPYVFWVMVDPREKVVVVSRDMDPRLPRMEVPSWSMRPRYQHPKKWMRFFGLWPFFLFDTVRDAHVVKYRATLAEISKRMMPEVDKIVKWAWEILYGKS